MEKVLNEVLSACERTVAEEKSGSRERSILSAVTKNLRKCIQEANAWQQSRKASGSRSSSTNGSPEKTDVSTADGAIYKQPATPGTSSQVSAQPVTASVDSSAQVDPRRLFLTSPDSLNRLAFASRIAITGSESPSSPTDKSSSISSPGSGGSVSRGNVKALVSSLELVALLLNSGLMATEMELPVPTFAISNSSSSGAHAFFSKILGNANSKKTPAEAAGESSPPASQTPSLPESAAQSAPVEMAENVRDGLVDAVFAASPMALAKDASDKLLFVFLAALQAAAVPAVSRADPAHLGNKPEELRCSCLALHGQRLVRAVQLLYATFFRPGLSPVLAEEARGVLQKIVKALSKYTELEIRSSSASVERAPSLPSVHRPAPGYDLINMLEFCCAVCRVAPLSSNPGQPAALFSQAPSPSPVAPNASCTAFAGMSSAAQLDAAVAPFATYSAMVLSLGCILHILVNGGHMFRKTESIIKCIQQSVVPCAVRTSLSSETEVFRYSLNVVLSCCVMYSSNMVNETSTVFRHVYFRVLESKFTSSAFKTMVIEAFQRYIEEPQNIIALFLNYDCNTRSQSIYEEMINYLGAMARVKRPNAQGKKGTLAPEVAAFADPSDTAAAINLEYDVPEDLRRKAMQTLLLLADSNIQWIERFETDQVDGDEQRGGEKGTLQDSDDVAAANNVIGLQKQVTEVLADGTEDAAAGAGSSAAAVPGTTNNGAFLNAHRYKDAVKKFSYLFNDKSSPESAIDYLCNCLFVLQKEIGDSQSPDDKSLATSSTPPPTGAAESSKEASADTESGAIAGVETNAVETAKGAPLASGAETDGESTEKDASESTEEEIRLAAKVARFFYEHEDLLDKIVLGEFFAKSFRKTNHRLVFEEWIKLYDFTGLKVDEALRVFLGGFKLLGEAQIVDRTMELFAGQYCRQNPSVFSSADTAFILSFSICMLNTDAHSAHIKHKMTVEEFIRNNKGIDEGNDVDPAILRGVFNRIAKDEIVLRPSRYPTRANGGSTDGSSNGSRNSRAKRRNSQEKLAGGIFESIPILRHLSPLADAITDKVLLPMDAAVGNGLFGGAQRKREEMYQEELRAALKEITASLQSSAALPHSAFITATSIENALPMWEVTVDMLCRLLIDSLQDIFDASERYVSPEALAQAEEGALPSGYDPVQAYMKDTESYEYFQVLLRGLTSTVHVCCSFGNVTHTEVLIEQAFELTKISQAVILSSTANAGPRVQVVQRIPRTRLELLVCFMNLFMNFGGSFGVRGWQAGYTVVSLLDALANGIEGMWKRQTQRLLQRAESNNGLGGCNFSPLPALPSQSDALPAPAAGAGQVAGTAPNPASISSVSSTSFTRPSRDLWFGLVRDVPSSITPESVKRRENILNTIRVIPGSTVDLWLERLFDATHFPTQAQLQMANGLVKVCQKELQHGRTFTLTKLFDFVTVCASISTRLQWRDLWANASSVFVMAGKMNQATSCQALDGLRIVALTYLMREELLNYSFQKEVLKPFEDILMSNQDVTIRRRVVNIVSEVIDFRAAHLASGWHVVFTCLSHAAVIPEVVGIAWNVCERVMAHYVDHMKDCFNDLVFCLTTFACTNVDEQIPLLGISYLVGCGHWLQYGLEAPPKDVKEAADVVQWACRFRTAEREAKASVTHGKHLTRVSLAAEPLTPLRALTKPGTYVTKTQYHLWMSLFEGLIPIVVVHASVRVRAHAVCCIYALLREYGGVFATEVQDSLFTGTLRPVLATLISHVLNSGDDALDKADHRLVVYLALRGLVIACSESAHLLELCCDTVLHLSTNLAWTAEAVRNDLVDVWVRVCCDMLSAVTSSSEAEPLGARDDNSLNAPAGVGLQSNTSFALTDRSLYSSFSSSAQVYATPSWVPQPDAKRKESNPFFVGLLHEALQVGAVDVVRLKRSAGWTEIHAAAAVTTTRITLPPALRTYSLQSLVRNTSLKCLVDGLLLRLIATANKEMRGDRAQCLAFARAIRHAMLGLSLYCVLTKDMEGVCRLLDTVRVLTTVKGEKMTGQSQENNDCTADLEDSPVELLLCLPYVTVLLDFIFVFPMDFMEASKAMLHERCTHFLKSLADSREYCVEQQLHVQEAFATRAAADGLVLKPYKGKSFIDIFRCGRTLVGASTRNCTTDTAPEVRRRLFHEWKYLCSIMAVRCALSVGPGSVLLSCMEQTQIFSLMSLLPSELEEATVSDFFNSCWVELDLHCSMPQTSTMNACITFLRGSSPLSSPRDENLQE